MNPRAHLVYGVDVDYESMESLPWSPFGDDVKPDFEDWAMQIVRIENSYEAVNRLPIAEVLYDWDNQRLMIAVNGTVSSETWDGPSEAVTTVTSEQIEAAKAFCAKHGIGFENPKWLLVAEYS